MGAPTVYVHRLIIVAPLAKRAAANVETKKVDAAGGDKTFDAGSLSASGVAPATHSWCSWAMTDAELAALSVTFKDGVNGYRVFDGNKTTSDEALVACGLKRIATVLK